MRAAWLRLDGGMRGGGAALISRGVCAQPTAAGDGLAAKGDGLAAAGVPAAGSASVGACFFVGEREPSGRALGLAPPDARAADVVVLRSVIDGAGAYRQLAKKVLGALRWATSSARPFVAQYVLKLDDDVFVHAPLLAAHLGARAGAAGARAECAAYLGAPRRSLVDRQPRSSAFVPHEAYAAAKWCPYNQGIHYALSANLATLLARGDDDGLLNAPGGVAGEDVSLALWLREAGVHAEAVPWMHYVHAGRWRDNDEAEPEVARGCACDGAPGVDARVRGPAVLGLDSPTERLLADELVRVRGAFAAGVCACERLPPRWLANEGTRLLRGANRPCDALRLFRRARDACARDPAASRDDELAHGGPRCEAPFVATLDEAIATLGAPCGDLERSDSV